MHPLRQELIFSQPNTKIEGFNENQVLASSTFREAVGRYNYLAARVPGASGLTLPRSQVIDWNIYVTGTAVVIGMIAVVLLVKNRQRFR